MNNGIEVSITVGADTSLNAIRNALVSALNDNDNGVDGIIVAAPGADGVLTLTAAGNTAGAAGAFVASVAGITAGNTATVDAISNGSVADNAAQSAATANTAAQDALDAANTAQTEVNSALTAAQNAANQTGAGSVAQNFLTDTQEQVTDTNASVASAVRDAAAAAQSAANAQAQADLAGADVGAIATAIAAANNAAIQAADEDADTAAEAAEAAFSQATANGTVALQNARSAIDDTVDMLELATSFDEVTLSVDTALDDGDVFTLIIDPTPADGASGDETTISVAVGTHTNTVAQGVTLADVRDTLVDAVNTAAGTDGNDLFNLIEATATTGDGRLIVASKTTGTAIGVTASATPADDSGITAESGSAELLSALATAQAAKTTIDSLFAGDLPSDAGTQTATALNGVVGTLNAAVATVRQTVTYTVGGTLEAGDELTAKINGTSVTIEVGTNTGGLTTVEAARDALVAAINLSLIHI